MIDPFRPFIIAAAMILDSLFGDPDWLYRRVPHPVTWMGKAIHYGEHWLNRNTDRVTIQRIKGMILIGFLTGMAIITGWGVQAAAGDWPYRRAIEMAIVGVLLAQRSLFDHVWAVYRPLKQDDVIAARRAVSRIVGRDPESLDRSAIARASVESLAENFSDGVIAPLFWYGIAGLPGLLAYKLINTADSMIGHKSARYRYFGWAAARLDDAVNFLPARLTGWLLVLAAGRKFTDAWRTMLRDARHHRSPNAGWPEAAMAGALGVALAGPRRYGGALVEDAWMGQGNRTTVNARDVLKALRIYAAALGLLWLGCAAAALFIYLNG